MCATCVRSCAASARDCDGVVYCCANVRDLVPAAMGSCLGWISCMFDCYVELVFDMVLLVIGS